MDTFSHVLIGFGLGALSQIDPSIANNPTLSQAVVYGTVIGSNERRGIVIEHTKEKKFRSNKSFPHLAGSIYSLKQYKKVIKKLNG